MEFSELPDEAKEALLNFVRALARRQARLDAAEGERKQEPARQPLPLGTNGR